MYICSVCRVSLSLSPNNQNIGKIKINVTMRGPLAKREILAVIMVREITAAFLFIIHKQCFVVILCFRLGLHKPTNLLPGFWKTKLTDILLDLNCR